MSKEHWQYVMMPVMCIGKICKDCPNLHIDTSVSEMRPGFDEPIYETDLRCRGLSRCMRLYKMMEEEHDKLTRQSP